MMKEFIQTGCPLLSRSLIVCAATLLLACTHQKYSSPEGYDLSKGEKMQLGKVLNEISGLSYNTDNNTLLAISDSKEQVIEINVKKQKLKDFTSHVVPKGSDIEDVVKLDSFIYMLASKGVIYEVPVKKGDSTPVKAYTFPSSDKNDFETLYYDPSIKGLVILCKTCAFDKGNHVRSAFRFDLATKQFDSNVLYTMNSDDVKKLLGDEGAKFDPSAAALHPENNNLYILSSAGNLLVIADNRGKIIEAHQLDPAQFPQAEGIAFAPDGEMYISNEGKAGRPTLQTFPYHKGKKN